MLILTAVFPGEMLSNIVEGSILVMMMARRVGFATVTSEFV